LSLESCILVTEPRFETETLLLNTFRFAHRWRLFTALTLILALGLGLAKYAQSPLFDYQDIGQELRWADDGDRADGGEEFILPPRLLLPFLPPGRPLGEPTVFFFASLSPPPATPPPITG